MKKHASFLTVAIAFAVVASGYLMVVNGRAIASLVPFVTTACTSTGPCIGGANTSSGAGVLATSANGRGLYATTKHNSTSSTNASFGVLGQDASASGGFNSGVKGLSVRGTGVSGASTSGYGVSGTSTDSSAVNGASTYGIGVVGTGFYGMEAIGGNGEAIYATTTGGNAIYANTGGTSVWALVAQSLKGSGVQITGGSRGTDSTGGYIGVVGRSPQFPIAGADSNGNIVFYVDASGNLHTNGTVSSASPVRGAVTSYTRTTSPAIEETGTAHLVYGAANVRLSSPFARSIDPRYGYQVFLTPGGDTRGLYVADKYARGFSVREVQGGRNSFDFDYHVYAHTQPPEVRQPLPALPPPTHVQAPPSVSGPGRS